MTDEQTGSGAPSADGAKTRPGEPAGAHPPPAPPLLLRITRGDPTDEELAALVTVVAGLVSAAAERPPAVHRSQWSAHARKLRPPHRHGPGAWRASAWPA